MCETPQGGLINLPPRTLSLGTKAAERVREGFAFVGLQEDRGGVEESGVMSNQPNLTNPCCWGPLGVLLVFLAGLSLEPQADSGFADQVFLLGISKLGRGGCFFPGFHSMHDESKREG